MRWCLGIYESSVLVCIDVMYWGVVVWAVHLKCSVLVQIFFDLNMYWGSMVYVWGTGQRWLIGCLVFKCHFPQKSSIISGSFAKGDLQLKASYASSPSCNALAFIQVECFYVLR